MKLYSTNNHQSLYSLKDAVMMGLAPDKGLFMPVSIPKLSLSFFQNLESKSFQEIALSICETLLGNEISLPDLERIISQAINFPAPLIELNDHFAVLELFHGPSLAFKDFGARFMAQLMSFYNAGNNDNLIILVATSGDTGGAVAAGFFEIPGIQVVILFPKGKVSDLQKKQLTTFGSNIHSLEIDGTFDDCQHLVKQSFVDNDLGKAIRLSSANSINIARLIPQSFYYFEGYKQIHEKDKRIIFSVPSGNFGNLTAGLIAKRMGLPIDQFIAATNINHIVPTYLETGIYNPKPSLETISNVMDVGNPSNFTRIVELYGSTWNNMTKDVLGFWCDDNQTRQTIKEVYKKYRYFMDPHGAVGFLALKSFMNKNSAFTGVVLETAHPAKFKSVMEETLNTKLSLPPALQNILHKPSNYEKFPSTFPTLKKYLLETFK